MGVGAECVQREGSALGLYFTPRRFGLNEHLREMEEGNRDARLPKGASGPRGVCRRSVLH